MAEMPKKSQRDLRKEETRDNLIASATRLFLEKGFDNTTIDEVSSAAGVSGRTFFRYFPTKEAIVFRDRAERLAIFRGCLATDGDHSDPIARLKMASNVVGEYYDSHRSVIATEYAIVAGSPFLTSENHAAFLRMEHVMAKGLHKCGGKTWMTRRQAAMFAAAFLAAHRILVWDCVNHGFRPPMKTRFAEICMLIDTLASATMGSPCPAAVAAPTVAPTASTPGPAVHAPAPAAITHHVPAKDD